MAPPSPSPLRRFLRPAILLAVVATLALVAHFTGLTAQATPEAVRALIVRAGAWGVLAYVVIFCVGELMHIPGAVFVVAGLWAWGRALGTPIAFVAGLCSVTFSFVVVRAVAGKPLAELRWAFLRRVMARLDERPLRTVALLRAVLWFAPPLNYALAMSTVGLRDYVLGSAIGLLLPIGLLAAGAEWLFR